MQSQGELRYRGLMGRRSLLKRLAIGAAAAVSGALLPGAAEAAEPEVCRGCGTCYGPWGTCSGGVQGRGVYKCKYRSGQCFGQCDYLEVRHC